MKEMVASIKLNGVLEPGLVRPEKDGNGYEVIAGHRRHRGSELAGLEEMPFIIREMTDHEAVQAMRDSNKQRDGKRGQVYHRGGRTERQGGNRLKGKNSGHSPLGQAVP